MDNPRCRRENGEAMRCTACFAFILLALGAARPTSADVLQQDATARDQPPGADRPALPPRGPDGRIILGGGEAQIARGKAALDELAELERRANTLSSEELAWGRHFLRSSLITGNAADGRLIAETLADSKADPYRRLAAAHVVLFAIGHLYQSEPQVDEEALMASEIRQQIEPFLKPVTDARAKLLEAAAATGELGGKFEQNEHPRSIRLAALAAAVDGGDAETFKKALQIAGDDAEHYARLIELAARRDPPLLERDEAALRPVVERLGKHLNAHQHREAVAEAIAAIGAPAGSLADDLVRTASPRRVNGMLDLDSPTSKAIELVGPAATEHLVPLLKDPDPRVRNLAIEALAGVYAWFPIFHQGEPRRPPRSVVEAVRALKQDPDDAVRDAADLIVDWWEREGIADDA